jgi:hypothetical protein
MSSRESHPRVDDWLDEDRIEYEVEPPDEDVSRSIVRLKEEAAANALQRASTDDGMYHAPPWEAQIAWRFTLRDLFALTAIIAISLTVYRLLGGFCPASVIGGLGIFFWTLIYMERNDPTVGATDWQSVPPANADPLGDEVNTRPGDRSTQQRWPPLRISYSTADLLIAMTVAAVCFALLRLFRPPLAAASLGFLVLAGIVLYWLGASPPRRAVLAWFILTAMYLVVSAIAVVGQ